MIDILKLIYNEIVKLNTFEKSFEVFPVNLLMPNNYHLRLLKCCYRLNFYQTGMIVTIFVFVCKMV